MAQEADQLPGANRPDLKPVPDPTPLKDPIPFPGSEQKQDAWWNDETKKMSKEKPLTITRKQRHEMAANYISRQNPDLGHLYSEKVAQVDALDTNSRASRHLQTKNFGEIIKTQPPEAAHLVASVDSVFRKQYFTTISKEIDKNATDPYQAIQQKLGEYRRLQEEASGAQVQVGEETKSAVSKGWLPRSIREEERKLYSAYIKKELAAGNEQHLEQLADENKRLAGILKDIRKKQTKEAGIKKQQEVQEHTATLQAQQLADYEQAQQAQKDYTASLSTAEGPTRPEPVAAVEETYDPRKETFEKNFANLQNSTLESDTRDATLNGNTGSVSPVGVITGGGRNRMHTAVSSSAPVLSTEQTQPENTPEESRIPHPLGESVLRAQQRNESATGGISAAEKRLDGPTEPFKELNLTPEKADEREKSSRWNAAARLFRRNKEHPGVLSQGTRYAIIASLIGAGAAAQLYQSEHSANELPSVSPIVRDVGSVSHPGEGLFTIPDSGRQSGPAIEAAKPAAPAISTTETASQQSAADMTPASDKQEASTAQSGETGSDKSDGSVSSITDALASADTTRVGPNVGAPTEKIADASPADSGDSAVHMVPGSGSSTEFKHGSPDVGAPVEDRSVPTVDVNSLNSEKSDVSSSAANENATSQQDAQSLVSSSEAKSPENASSWKSEMIEKGGTLGEYLKVKFPDFWTNPDVLTATYLENYDVISQEYTKDTGKPAMTKEEMVAWNVKANEELKALDERVAKGELTKDSDEYNQQVNTIMGPGRDAVGLIPADKTEKIPQSQAAVDQIIQTEKQAEAKPVTTQAVQQTPTVAPQSPTAQPASSGRSLLSRLFGRGPSQ